ncbi:cupin domain-containing protein [Allokutzneria sp. A3M-2-11 16]|uniref:cupin domain-containing protein n=1 Tax=Allokutzneria sp. A3M-2-11 16 TaxID=2962043 RepID=UPI0020B68E42|nr:cupin domain-containing protein [Allokutzneria sp. A3M-2-11 16]MCP3799921.1 cupin domain-containing protein [Allokutzneria sp. A3M-2-11 16]
MTEYSITTEPRFAHLERIDVGQVAAAVTEQWHNQTLCTVNDSVVRLGVLNGEFHWHKHDNEDEFFYVVEGRLIIEVEGREDADLGPGQAFTVPKGVMHRPIAPGRAVILMVEPASVRPTGD